MFGEVQGKWLEGAKEDGEDLRYDTGNLSGFLAEYRDRKGKESCAEFTAGAKYHAPNAFDLKIVALLFSVLCRQAFPCALNPPESYNSKQCVCLLG